MSDILEKLHELHMQATDERSHYYVGSVCHDARMEIERMQREIEDLKSFIKGIGIQCRAVTK